MEQVVDQLELEERRQRVAAFIKDGLQLSSHVLNEDTVASGDLDSQVTDSDFEVREYQLDAWANLWEARQQGKKRALVHLATGLGKTSVAVFDVMKFRQECDEEQGFTPRVLFVSHRDGISEQAQERFLHFMPELEAAYFKTKQQQLPDADVTFATFQSLNSELETFDPEYFDYIIYDEAHHSEAETFKQVRAYFEPLFELALTATPDRMDEKDIREYFGKPVFSKGLAEAMAEGWLADVDYHIVFDDIVKQLMEEGFEPKTLREFHELFKVRPRNEVIAKNILEERHKIGLDNAKTIVFCESVDHAIEMSKLLGGAAYHSDRSKLSKDKRKQILQYFRSGEQQVICTIDMFNEGIDIPDARLVVFLRSTESGTVFDQQLGRGLRRTKDKDRVSVLDFVANIERIESVRELIQKVRQINIQQGEGVAGVPELEGKDLGNAGIRIYSAHGEFEFNKMSVDLLDRWNSVRAQTGWSEFARLTNDELVALAVQIKPNGPLVSNEIAILSQQREFCSPAHIANRFGSISEFQKACHTYRESNTNIIVTKYIGSRHMTDSDLVALAAHIKPDGPLSAPEIKELSQEGKFASAGTIIKRFGSIAQFQTDCGYETLDLRNMTNDDIVALALELSPDAPLKGSDMKKLAREGRFPTYSMVNDRFESLDEFYEACGFKLMKRGMGAEEIVNIAKELSPDDPIRVTDAVRLSKEGRFVSPGVIYDRFGSFLAFHIACGFD